MQHVVPGKPRSLLEMAALAYGTALSLALIILFSKVEGESSAWWFCLAPLVASASAVASRARPIVWTALGACLAVGALTFLSIGLIVLQIGVCLFLWWLLSSQRAGRPVMTRSDLFWLTAGLDVMILPLIVI